LFATTLKNTAALFLSHIEGLFLLSEEVDARFFTGQTSVWLHLLGEFQETLFPP